MKSWAVFAGLILLMSVTVVPLSQSFAEDLSDRESEDGKVTATDRISEFDKSQQEKLKKLELQQKVKLKETQKSGKETLDRLMSTWPRHYMIRNEYGLECIDKINERISI